MQQTAIPTWADRAQSHRVARASLPLLCAVGLIAALYRPTFQWWWYEWTSPGSYYAHALFVPLFAGIMVWRNRRRLTAARWAPNWWGLVAIACALLLLMTAERSGVATMQSISFILLLLGGSILLLGTSWTRHLLFPLLFIVLMMPLVPDQLINLLAFPIQICSARMATSALNLLTLHAVREGTMIQMDGYRLAVELPCSGFKTLVSLLTFAGAFAYLVEGAAWKRWALFLTTVPLSLVINAIRIVLIGIVGELIGSGAAGHFHDWSGFIVLTLGFLFLFNFARLLRCDKFLGISLRESAEPQRSDESADGLRKLRNWWTPARALAVRSGLRSALPFVLALDLVLLAALAINSSAASGPRALPPIARSQTPLSLAGSGVTWRAITSAPDFDRLPSAVEDELRPSQVINRDYDGSDGSRLQFFLTAGNGRKVFHDPHTCSLGSDAVMTDLGDQRLGSGTDAVSAQESVYQRSNSPDRYEVLYFYVVEGQIVQRTEQIRNRMIAQMLFGDSGMPSYFFRVVQRSPGEGGLRRREAVRFATAMWKQIGPVLTGKRPVKP